MVKAQLQYSIAFNEHPIHENLKHLREQVDGLSDALLDAAKEHDPQASLARLEPALDYVGALLASADPALVTPQMLDELATPAQQIASALTLFAENEEWAQIPAVQTNVDGLLNAAMRIAPSIGVWAKTDAKKAAALLGEAATAKTHQLQEQASDLQGQLNQLREQATQATDSVKTTSEEQVKELEGQLETLKTEVDAERERAQQAINGFETQFKSEQDTRNSEFEESKKALTDQTEQVIQESKEAAAKSIGSEEERADKAVAELHERSKEIMDFLAEKKQEAIDTVDTAATSSIAGGFKKEAEEQKEQADKWRGNAINLGILAAAVAIAAVVLAAAMDEGNSPALLIGKIAVATLLLGIAGYAAGQSGQHRRREQRARRLYLQLVAFKPISEPLPEEKKNEVRKDFIERMFVGDLGEDHKDGDVKMSDENLSLVVKVIDALRSTSASS